MQIEKYGVCGGGSAGGDPGPSTKVFNFKDEQNRSQERRKEWTGH